MTIRRAIILLFCLIAAAASPAQEVVTRGSNLAVHVPGMIALLLIWMAIFLV